MLTAINTALSYIAQKVHNYTVDLLLIICIPLFIFRLTKKLIIKKGDISLSIDNEN